MDMSFEVRISGVSQTLEKCIESVACRVDTPNDVNARTTDVSNFMEITGRVGTEEATVALYLWSLLPATDPKAYRNVEVQFKGQGKRILRNIIFPNAFVVDYSESYSTHGGEGSFCLLIKQKKDKKSDVVVEGETMNMDLD